MQHVSKHQNNLIGILAQHKVAANLLMVMMIMSGIWALSKLNTQFLPNFALDFISVTVIWTGATAEDVEIAISVALEQELRGLDSVRKIQSTSTNAVSNIILEYEKGTDMGWALDQVKEKVALLRNLPSTAENPEITRLIHYEGIASVLITGPTDSNELRTLAQQMERDLLARGIGKIDISGLPDEEIAIQIPTKQLVELGLTLPQVADKITQFSRDLPAGSIGRDDVARQLRSLGQSREELAFANLPLITDKAGRYLKLDDIAIITRRPINNEVRITYQGKPAVELGLKRSEHEDALKAAKILQTWLEDIRPTLPPNVKLQVYNQAWELIDQRISLLLRNGLGGLILVVAVLFLFLTRQNFQA